MKTIRNTLVVAAALFLLILGDAPPDARFGFQLVSDAHAVFGVRRRHVRRAVIVTSAAAASSATAAQQQAAPAPQPAAAAAKGKLLPLGTVVHSLPDGCVSKPSGGVEYQYCGGNYYRAVFQGNNLVYVTAKP